MAFTSVPTVITGQTWTAANHNTYIKDNFAAVWPYTTAGDLAYATSSSALSRLGIGTAGQLLKTNVGATAPAWVSPDDVISFAGDYVDTEETVTGDSTWRDPATAGPSITLTIGEGGKVLVFYSAEMRISTVGNALLGLRVDASDPNNARAATQYNQQTGYRRVTYYYYDDTATPGASVVYKMRYFGDAGTVTLRRRRIVGLTL